MVISRRSTIAVVVLVLTQLACDKSATEPPRQNEVTPWELLDLAAVNSAGLAVGMAGRMVTPAGSDSSYQQLAGALWRVTDELTVIEQVTAFVDVNETGHVVGFLEQDGAILARLCWCKRRYDRAV